MTSSSPRKVRILPGTKAGWWAFGLSLLGIASWIIPPVIASVFWLGANPFIMALAGTIIIDIAVIFNVLCLWYWRERSVLNVALTVLVILAALFITSAVVYWGITGV